MAQSEREVERLVRENQKLVHYAVNRYLKRYSVRGMEREDLVSWGRRLRAALSTASAGPAL
jgi:DNA-directed RNA polymerase specialized sigma subunit